MRVCIDTVKPLNSEEKQLLKEKISCLVMDIQNKVTNDSYFRSFKSSAHSAPRFIFGEYFAGGDKQLIDVTIFSHRIRDWTGTLPAEFQKNLILLLEETTGEKGHGVHIPTLEKPAF